jgi:hypothetical protein
LPFSTYVCISIIPFLSVDFVERLLRRDESGLSTARQDVILKRTLLSLDGTEDQEPVPGVSKDEGDVPPHSNCLPPGERGLLLLFTSWALPFGIDLTFELCYLDFDRRFALGPCLPQTGLAAGIIIRYAVILGSSTKSV